MNSLSSSPGYDISYGKYKYCDAKQVKHETEAQNAWGICSFIKVANQSEYCSSKQHNEKNTH